MVMKPFKKQHLQKGVTLIELLVAVGLVVVLTALLLPVISGASRSSNDAKCLSNLRMTGAMVQALIVDSNNRLVTRAGGATLSGYYFWTDRLWREGYLSPAGSPSTQPDQRTIAVLRCPSAPYSTAAWPWFTYGMNMYDSRGTLDMKGPKKDARIFELHISRIHNPSSYVLIADSINSTRDSQHARIGAKPTFLEGIELRHQGKAHIFFLDGHIGKVDRQAAAELGIPNIYDAIKRN